VLRGGILLPLLRLDGLDVKRGDVFGCAQTDGHNFIGRLDATDDDWAGLLRRWGSDGGFDRGNHHAGH